MGRTLIYIPIIHTNPDLGSLASDIEEKAARVLGERWQSHKKTVEQYWEQITRYFSARGGSAFGRENRNVRELKIFQDSLPVGGEKAQSMVGKLAKTGSPNYRLLKGLVSQGAFLVKTEDEALLKKEYQVTKELVAKKNLLLKIFTLLNYKFKKGRLLKARDNYIANQINQNLGEGETGVCFLGAYHRIVPRLAKDIKLVLFKNPYKVREYYQALSSEINVAITKDLACYLTTPVKNGLVVQH